MREEIIIPRDQIAAFCQRWKISEFALFGSALRDDFDADSDVDVLVTFAPDARWSLLDEVRMEQELEAIFQRDVDLVSRDAIEDSQNWMRRNAILSSARTIYVS